MRPRIIPAAIITLANTGSVSTSTSSPVIPAASGPVLASAATASTSASSKGTSAAAIPSVSAAIEKAKSMNETQAICAPRRRMSRPPSPAPPIEDGCTRRPSSRAPCAPSA